MDSEREEHLSFLAPYLNNMSDILHRYPVNASAKKVYNAITSPEGLNSWWTLKSEGSPVKGSIYRFFFEEAYDWYASVEDAQQDTLIRWKFSEAEPDWTGTRLEMRLSEKGDWTWIEFAHTGWSDASEHFRISSNCWAQYLRLLKHYLEKGEVVPYKDRLNV